MLINQGTVMKLYEIAKTFFLCLWIITYTTTIAPVFKYDERLITEEELFDLIAESKKEDECISDTCDADLAEMRSVNPKKPMTFMVFIAADNDLHYFAWKNIQQMELVGSNHNINIVIQISAPGLQKPTKRFLVKKGKRFLIQDPDGPNKKLNSGSPYTLIDFVDWATSHYPADDYALVLWNHGTGMLDPIYNRTINPCELFYCNPSDGMLEIDRGISYISLILQYAQKEANKQKRGICFDETFKSYLNNQDFEFALHEICTKVLRGKKLSLLAFDACLMSMIEIASIAKKYAHYMVGSQEVEYGTGWNYEYVLRPFLQRPLSPYELARHIVSSYELAYKKITNEYTQSAFDLSVCQELEDNINSVSNLLVETLAGAHHKQTINILRKCKSTQYCTCFDEPSYIDLGHFYRNLLQHQQYLNLSDKTKEKQLQANLQYHLQQGLNIINKFVIANKVGQRLKNAQGVSIYFPEHSVSHSYLRSSFAIANNWSTLLAKYILG